MRNLKALTLAIAVLCISAVSYSAVTKVGNAIRMTVSGDSIEWASSDASIVKFEVTPSTTGTLFQIRQGSITGAILWETTATETRPTQITTTNQTIVPGGGMPKIQDEVTINPGNQTLFYVSTDTLALGCTGIYIYTGRKDGNN